MKPNLPRAGSPSLRPTVRVHAAGVAVDDAPAMFPGIAWAGEDIVASFSTVPDGWPGGEVGIVRSSDRGATWSEPTIVARSEAPIQAVLNAVGLATLPDGTLLLPYNGVRWSPGAGAGGRVISLHLLRSEDGGITWSGTDRIDVDFASPCVYGEILSLDDRLLWPVWGQKSTSERWRSAILESVDGGRSWLLGATIGFDPDARLSGSYANPAASGLTSAGDPDPSLTADPSFRPHSPIDGFSETTVAQLQDGSLLAILRQQGVHGDHSLQLFSARSVDRGRSWTTPRPVGFAGMSPLLHPVSDGLLLAYRRHLVPGDDRLAVVEVRRAGIDGIQWSQPVELIDPHGSALTEEYQCGYPAMLTTGRDRVLTLFYSFKNGRRFIAWNVLDLSAHP